MRKAIRTYTRDQLEIFPRVRVLSFAGPCLTHYRKVRDNPRAGTVTIVYWNHNGPATHIVTDCLVHTEACSRCTDHPETCYPRGYEG